MNARTPAASPAAGTVVISGSNGSVEADATIASSPYWNGRRLTRMPVRRGHVAGNIQQLNQTDHPTHGNILICSRSRPLPSRAGFAAIDQQVGLGDEQVAERLKSDLAAV